MFHKCRTDVFASSVNWSLKYDWKCLNENIYSSLGQIDGAPMQSAVYTGNELADNDGDYCAGLAAK